MKVQKLGFYLLLLCLAMASPTLMAIDYDGDGHAAIADGGDDCDDHDPNRFPGWIEVCDDTGHDEDCDDTTFGTQDMDGDGFIADRCYNTAPDGTEYRGLDCDDTRTNINPMAPDFCDGRDNNCDGAVDDSGRIIQFADDDLDGFGDPLRPTGIYGICPGTAGYSPVDGDCDDSNPAIQAGDMICDASAQFATAILVCTGAGSWQLAACAEGTVCQAQVNGTGVCVPEDSKAKKK